MTVSHTGQVDWDMRNIGKGKWKTTGEIKIVSMATKEEVDGCQKLESEPGQTKNESIPWKQAKTFLQSGPQKPSDDELDYCDQTKCKKSPIERHAGESTHGGATTKIFITLIESYTRKTTSTGGCFFSPGGVQPITTTGTTSITTQGAPKKSDLIKAVQIDEESGEPPVELPKYDFNAGDNEFGFPPKTAGTATLRKPAKCNYYPKTDSFVKKEDAKELKPSGKTNLIVNNAVSHWAYPQIDAAFPGFRDGIRLLDMIVGDIKGTVGWEPMGKCRGMKD